MTLLIPFLGAGFINSVQRALASPCELSTGEGIFEALDVDQPPIDHPGVVGPPTRIMPQTDDGHTPAPDVMLSEAESG